MTLDQITERGINPALRLLPAKMDTPAARVILLTIGQQESGGFMHRRQIVWAKDADTGKPTLKPVGPAKSFWMGEIGGGLVHGVRTHPATRELASVLYAARQVKPTDLAIWNAIENDDVLAAGLARLLIYSDPYVLPPVGDAHGAWSLYMRTWRPGQPRPESWPAYYAHALNFAIAAAA